MARLTVAQIKKECADSYSRGYDTGVVKGKIIANAETQEIRRQAVIEISRAVADVALANAKLTYALSRITDKLL